MTKRSDTIDHAETFDSMAQFVRYAADTPGAWGDDFAGRYDRDDKPRAWNGNVTLGEAADLATYGWPEGRDQMTDVAASAEVPELRAVSVEDWQRDVAGAYPDIALAVAGDPCSMWDQQPTEVMTRVLRVQVTLGASFTVPAEFLTRYGVALLAYIDALEHAGWRVELTGTWDTRGGTTEAWRVSVMLKDAGQPLDLDTLAFAIAHPAMLRRLCFAWLETVPTARRICHNYGVSRTADPAGYDVTFPRIPTDIPMRTVDDALAFIREHTNLLTDPE